jgi:hypothetical protein
MFALIGQDGNLLILFGMLDILDVNILSLKNEHGTAG